MDNKQLFKQSAGKILSRNQLEGVMRLHNAIFEGVSPEQVADTVDKLDGKVTALEEKPGKRWESIVEKLIWLFVGGVITAALAQAGII